VRFLSRDGVFTEKSEALLDSMCERISSDAGLRAELKSFVLSLPPSEQWVISIPASQASASGCDKLINQLTREYFSNPFLAKEENVNLLPSLSIIQFCMRKVSRTPVKLQFGFGSIGTSTLDRLHREGKHFIPLYAPAVLSNMTRVHDLNCGPVGGPVHDLAHAYWGSLLSIEFRQSVYDIFRPCMEKLKKLAQDCSDTETIDTIDDVIWQLGDFDLLNLAAQKTGALNLDVNQREQLYLQTTFGTYRLEDARNEKRTLGTGLYFLIERMLHVDSTLNTLSGQEYGFLQQASDLLKSVITRRNQSTERGYAYPSALSVLAKSSNNDNEYAPPLPTSHPLSWQDWLCILESSNDSKLIWDQLNAEFELRSELLFSISECHLAYFHPYVPLTEHMRKQCIEWVKQSRRKCMEVDIDLIDLLSECEKPESNALMKAILRNQADEVFQLLASQPDLKQAELILPTQFVPYFLPRKKRATYLPRLLTLDFVLQYSDINLEALKKCFGDEWFQHPEPEQLVFILKRLPKSERAGFIQKNSAIVKAPDEMVKIISLFENEDRLNIVMQFRSVFRLFVRAHDWRKLANVLPEQDRISFALDALFGKHIDPAVVSMGERMPIAERIPFMFNALQGKFPQVDKAKLLQEVKEALLEVLVDRESSQSPEAHQIVVAAMKRQLDELCAPITNTASGPAPSLR
jgi:hypothetical protein